MRNRVPVVLSAAALVVAVLGVTPVGQATSDSIQTHFARNASFLRGKAPSIRAGKNKIPVAGPNGKLHASWGATGRAGPFPDALPSGKSIRGNYSMGGTAAAVGHLANASLSFDFAYAAHHPSGRGSATGMLRERDISRGESGPPVHLRDQASE